MIDNIKKYGQIMGTLLLAYFVSIIVGDTVFMNKTPVMRPNLMQYIAIKTQSQFNTLIAGLGINNGKQSPASDVKSYAQVEKSMDSIPFSQLTKGVYAKDNGVNSITVIKSGELETVEYSYVINGKIVKIRVPKNFPLSEQQIKEAVLSDN